MAKETVEEAKARHQREAEEKDNKLNRVKEILLKNGIEMNIFGCGCCGSPEISFRYKGEQIFENEECCNITMISEDEVKS